MIGILYDLKIPVHDQDTPAIHIGQHFKLAVYSLGAGIIEIIFLNDLIAKNTALIADCPCLTATACFS